MQDEPTVRDVMTALMELHSAVSLGFERIEARFNGVDKRFNGVDERFNSVDERFNNVDKRFTRIEAEVAGLQRWMARSDERFAALEAR